LEKKKKSRGGWADFYMPGLIWKSTCYIEKLTIIILCSTTRDCVYIPSNNSARLMVCKRYTRASSDSLQLGGGESFLNMARRARNASEHPVMPDAVCWVCISQTGSKRTAPPNYIVSVGQVKT
jgi:hypothetical protein